MAFGSFMEKSRQLPAAQSYSDVKPLLKWVYAWMMIGLLVTTATAIFTANTPALLALATNPIVVIIAFVVQIGVVIAIGVLLKRLSPGATAALFLFYAATLGFSLSLVLLMFNVSSLAAAFGTTAVLFGIMTVIGFTTDIDLSRFRNLLFMALIGVIVASFINLLLGSSVLTLIISIVGVLVFMGLTAYDTQNIRRMASSPEIQADGSMVAKFAIYGALSLYLNFINIFLFLLQIMGGSSD